MKQPHDEMSAGLADATKDEEINAYEGLMAAKKKEVNALLAQRHCRQRHWIYADLCTFTGVCSATTST